MKMAAVWAKTEAGRQEIRTRSRVTSRLRRTLLLLVDGRHSEAELLAAVQGTTVADIEWLHALGLIEPAAVGAPAAAEAADEDDDEVPSWTIPGAPEDDDDDGGQRTT